MRICTVVVGLGLVAGCTDAPVQQRTYFERNIEPILAQTCAAASGCHSDTAAAGNLDVTSYEAVSQRPDLFVPYAGSDYSLFLIKAVGPGVLTSRDGTTIEVPHAAGTLMAVGSEAFLSLQIWITNGATETGLPE